MPFVDHRKQLLAEAGRRVKGGHKQDKRIDHWWVSLPLIVSCHLGWLVRYVPFIVVLFHRPWRLIWSSFAHTIPAIRSDEPQLMCVFLLDLISVEERALPIDSRWEE
jgi:hypothetical protein